MRRIKAAGLAALAILCILCLSACSETDASKYDRAQKLLSEGKYAEAAGLFEGVSAFEDAPSMARYAKALAAAESGDYASAISGFKALGSFMDCSMMITYFTGKQYESRAGKENWSAWVTAAEYYDMVSGFLDSTAQAETCRKAVYDESVRLAGNGEYGQSAEMLKTIPQYSDSSDLRKYYAAFKLEQENR